MKIVWVKHNYLTTKAKRMGWLGIILGLVSIPFMFPHSTHIFGVSLGVFALLILSYSMGFIQADRDIHRREATKETKC